MKEKKYEKTYKDFLKLLKEFNANPNKVTEEDEKSLKAIFFSLFEPLKYSKHSAWKVDWQLEKRHNADDVDPYETITETEYCDKFTDVLAFAGNIILDNGATEMLKLIAGDGTATPYNNANAKIYVGTDGTAEKANQTGVIATDRNRAYANMESGYPIVSGRTVTFRASFGNDTANFDWHEVSVTNGTGVGAIALNRKVEDMGRKNGGTWTMQVSISLVSA